MVQTVTTEIHSKDLNDDGITDELTTVVREMTDGRVDVLTTTTADTLYPHSTTSQIVYTYDDLDLADAAVHEVHSVDWGSDGAGGWDSVSTLDRLFDGEGHTVQEVVSSPDWDADGAPDYQNTTVFTENFAGSLTQKLTTFSSYGITNPADYELEQWTYAADGQKELSHMVDKPFFYDCVITDYNQYRADGQISKITQSNEIRFGTEAPKTTDTFSYTKAGILKEHTQWGEYTDYGWGKWVQDQYLVETPAYSKEQRLIDLDGDYKADFNIVTETWRNAEGQDTDVLISHYEKYATLIQRDKIDMTWADGVMVEMTNDINIYDGVVEEHFTSTTVDVLVA